MRPISRQTLLGHALSPGRRAAIGAWGALAGGIRAAGTLAAVGLGALGPGAAAPLHGEPVTPAACTAPADTWLERESYLMGTLLTSRVEGADRTTAAAATEAAVAEIRRLEALLSTWYEGSTLSALNRAPVGEAADVPPELAALLAVAGRWQEATGGAFHPVVGPLVDAWDLRGAGRVPGPAALEAALAGVRAGFHLDPAASTLTRLHPAAWIDTGAFGKGAALAAAREALAAHGVENGLLNFGGQVLALGSPPDASPAGKGGGDAGAGRGWPVTVAHPTHRATPVAELRLTDVSAATSGASERFIEVDGKRFGHLLDPRTGRPVPAWGSVTVVHADPLIADILSTALFVMGPEEGMAWLALRPELAALFLEDTAAGPRATWSPAMARWLASLPAGIRPAALPDRTTGFERIIR